MISNNGSKLSRYAIKFLVDDEIKHFINKVSDYYQQRTPFTTVQKTIISEAQHLASLSLKFLEIPKSSALYSQVYDNTIVLGQVITWCFFYGSNSPDIETRKSITAKSDAVVNTSNKLHTLLLEVITVIKRKIAVFSIFMAISFVVFVIGCILLLIALVRFIVKQHKKSSKQPT